MSVNAIHSSHVLLCQSWSLPKFASNSCKCLSLQSARVQSAIHVFRRIQFIAANVCHCKVHVFSRQFFLSRRIQVIAVNVCHLKVHVFSRQSMFLTAHKHFAATPLLLQLPRREAVLQQRNQHYGDNTDAPTPPGFCGRKRADWRLSRHRPPFRLWYITFSCLLIIIIMYIYHALINALSAGIHVNLNIIFYTHVEHSPTKTIYIKYYTEKHTHTHTD